MKQTGKLFAAIMALVLVAGCSSTASPTPAPATAAPTAAPATLAPTTAPPTEAPTVAPTPGAPEAWTQSDIFKGFDPLALDLQGYTPGPNGEHSTAAADVADPTAECVQKIKDQKLKLAFMSGMQITWFAAIEKGVRAKAAEYGIDVVTTATSDFDPAKEAAGVETMMASKPDILIGFPVDPTAGKQSYKPALDAGTTIVFYDNPVDGWTAGNQYVTIVTGDHYRMGVAAAELLAKALNDKGEWGFIQQDTIFYNANNREKGFIADLVQKHPNIKNVAWAGFTDPATVGPATDAMLTQHANLDGIVTTYSGGPGTAVLASLNAAGNTHTRMVTWDLDAANDVIMAKKDSNYYGTAIEITYEEGANTVKAAVLDRCGVDVPPFIVVPAMGVTRDNLAQAWTDALKTEPPAEVRKALGQ